MGIWSDGTVESRLRHDLRTDLLRFKGCLLAVMPCVTAEQVLYGVAAGIAANRSHHGAKVWPNDGAGFRHGLRIRRRGRRVDFRRGR